MEYRLNQIAIHELVKEVDSGDVSLKLGEELLELNENSEKLAERLHKIFSQKNDILQGLLASPEDGLFPAYFRILEETGFAAEAFLQFSRDSMQALKLGLEGVVGAKGGYLVFLNYEIDQQQFLSISLLRNTDGLVFTDSDTGAFRLNATTYLDIDRLALSCRIKIENNASDYVAVEVIKHARTQKDISAYFLNWLAIEETVDSKEMTTHFLEAISSIPVPVDEETGDPVDKGVFREQVTKFAMKNPSKTINVAEFEENFYGQEEKPLQAYFSENEMKVNEEFRFDRGTIRNYEFHKFKSKGLYFGCKHTFLLDGKVSIDSGKIIIDDEDLVEEIAEILRNV